MFNKLSYNPAVAGSEGQVCLNMGYLQWANNIEGAPAVANFNIHLPFNLFGATHGVGLSFENDKIGLENNIGFRLNYSYRFDVGLGKLGIGVYGGLINSTFTSGDLKTGNLEATDPSYPQSDNPIMTPDFGFGIFYNEENIYMGLSTTHLTQSVLKYNDQGVNGLYYSRKIYVSSGYHLDMSTMLAFQPSVMIESNLSTTAINLSGILVYNSRIWGGISYKTNSSVTGLFGIQLFDGIQFGVAYQYPLAKFSQLSTGNLEVLVRYCFSLKKEKIPQKYKSVRFL